MHKQQYTLLLMRDDGVNRNIRFCANTLRLLVALCIIIPVAMVASVYMASQYWQDAAIMAHNNEELRHELHVYQQELQKYTNIQRLVKDYEHEASPILIASQAVPAAVPYAVEEAATSGDARKDDVEATGAEVASPNIAPDAGSGAGSDADQGVGPNTGPDSAANGAAGQNKVQNADDVSSVAMADGVENKSSSASDATDSPSPSTDSAQIVSENVSTDATQAVAEAPQKPSIEDILQQQNLPQGTDHDSFTMVTDKQAKLTDLTIRESKGQVKTTFQLVNNTNTSIAGHIYIAIQGHDKQLHPISISEKHTAFRIMRYRDYDLNFALPSGFSAADVDKVVITAKTRDGEVFYCNGFALE